jgi:hypothetical protein
VKSISSPTRCVWPASTSPSSMISTPPGSRHRWAV